MEKNIRPLAIIGALFFAAVVAALFLSMKEVRRYEQPEDAGHDQ